MAGVLRSTWPLLIGVMLLMVGNGMQSTLLGIRGNIEGIPTGQMSIVMSAYFGGFLAGSLIAPKMIQNVGHVRVFAALGSLISAVLIMYAVAPDWIAWSVMRFAIGFAFCGVYITAESWLNAGSDNQTRGQALSAYMIVQMAGIIIAQLLLNAADPAGFMLFIIPSILVSLSFTPILLTAKPMPMFETIKKMSFKDLYKVSPLGCVGVFLMGGVFSAMFGMSAVWGAEAGLSVRDISFFVSAIYAGGLLVQYPLGYFSDRMDRRNLILGLCAVGTLTTIGVALMAPGSVGLIFAGAVIGGVANPVYAMLLAYTNDYLDLDDMPAASAGLLFINGLGSVSGPLIVGYLMSVFGPDGFWIYMGVLMAFLAAYTGWRMTRRPAVASEDRGGYVTVAPVSTQYSVGAALDEAQSAEHDGDEVPSTS